MSHLANRFFCIPVCRECSLHNAAIYEDYINNNWSSDSGDTMILDPCCHQLQQQHFDSSEEILGLEQKEDLYENILGLQQEEDIYDYIKVEPEDDDGDEIKIEIKEEQINLEEDVYENIKVEPEGDGEDEIKIEIKEEQIHLEDDVPWKDIFSKYLNESESDN